MTMPGSTGPAPPSLGTGVRRQATVTWEQLEVGKSGVAGFNPFSDIAEEQTEDGGAPMEESDIEHVLGELNGDLVAMHEVKTRIREIAALLVIERLRRSIGLVAQAPTMHMCFTGNPGTG